MTDRFEPGASRLTEIIDAKMTRLDVRRRHLPLEEIRHRAADAPAPRDFYHALSGPEVSIIAEVKRASPSRGLLAQDLDAVGLARAYERGGTAAVSVLTEGDFFLGSLEDMWSVREAISLPVLCKDFLICPYQVYEARAFGADAILLIAAILSDDTLAELLALARDLGMAALVEVHTEAEIRRPPVARATTIGINNRDLDTFEVQLDTFESLAPLAPDGGILVAESGITTPADIARMRRAGAHAVLIGEALVRADDPEALLQALLADGKGGTR